MRLIVAIILSMNAALMHAQTNDNDTPERLGDAVIAEKYLQWAENAIAAEQWQAARAALERASDFSDVLSDISYLLAIARFKEKESPRSVLAVLDKAVKTGNWVHYSEAKARFLQAEQFLILRNFSDVLNSLDAYKNAAGDNAESVLLRLAALKRIGNSAQFRDCMAEALNLYPRDPRFLRVFFNFAGSKPLDEAADSAFSELLETILQRLPFLVELDPDLAWMAAPYLSDTEEARRLVAAYRSGSLGSMPGRRFNANTASIIPALNLGLLDDIDAIDELFNVTSGASGCFLDKDLIIRIANLLRSNEGRDLLAEKLHSFTGEITTDDDADGIVESRAVYQKGILQEFYSDADQDSIYDIVILFNAGEINLAETFALPVKDFGRLPTVILWERYPFVHQAVLGKETYLFAPASFRFVPVDYIELCASDNYAGLLFPQINPLFQGVTQHMLASFAVSVQRPSEEFEGGVELMLLEKGMPVRSEVTLNGRIVSVTVFLNGKPLLKRMDLDMDGRIETIHYLNNEEAVQN